MGTEAVTEANRALVDRFFTAFSAGDVDGVLACLHADLEWWTPGDLAGVSGSKGKDAWGEGFRGAAALFKGGTVRLTPGDTTAEGDRVAVEASSYGELEDGRLYENTYHFLFVVRDGALLRVKEYCDTDHTRHVLLGG